VTPEALRRLRRHLKITQAELAATLGVRSETVARWEIGSRRISEPMARLIERVAAERRPQQRKP